MIAILKKLGLIVFVAAGVGLFILKKAGTVPTEALFRYISIWFSFGVGGTVLLTVLDRNLATHRREKAGAGKPVAAGPLRQSLSAADDPHSGPSVVLARAERHPEFDVTRDGTSWFGGLPALGQQPWPLDGGGQPMTPLAQIDLTGLTERVKVPGLPTEGSLAFFAALPETGRWSGHAVHVLQPGPPTAPPGPLPPVMNHSFGGPLRRGETGDTQRLFPRMAMQLVPIAISAKTDPEGFDAEVEAALGAGREGSLSSALFKEAIPDANRPFNRDSLLRFLRGARIALASGEAAEKKLRDLHVTYASVVARLTGTPPRSAEERDQAAAQLVKARKTLKRLDDIFRDYDAASRQMVENLATLDTWAANGDRWQALTEPEQAMLAPLLEPLTAPHGLGWAHLTETSGIHRSMQDCVDETLLVMAVAEDGVFNSLPEPLRAAINGPWRQPYRRSRHQMFGSPASLQSAAEDNANAFLLLQLQSDDIAGFHWGDAGVLQFWIRPEDLESGHWERVCMTFEGH